jgi:hypothetical protein
MAKEKLPPRDARKDKTEAAGRKVLNDLKRRMPDIIDVLDGMAENRELPKPTAVAAYLGLLIEEADFSLECEVISTEADMLIEPRPGQKGKKKAGVNSHPKGAIELADRAASARYSADLWEVASKIKALGIEPIYKW